jgi:adenylate cyclase
VARLLISSPDGKRGILEITKPVITVGRGHSNDLVLHDASVSRFHAVIKQLPNGTVVIADRGSVNTVRVNGHKITDETAITDGDVAHVGTYEVRFESVDNISFVIKKAEISPTMNNVLHGLAAKSLEIDTPTGTAEDLVREIKKLEKEKFLLTVLYDAGKALNSKLSLADVTEQVMSLVFRIEGVERGFMMFLDNDGRSSLQTDMRYRSEQPKDTRKIILSSTIIERLKNERQPILISDPQSDARFAASESMKISGLRSAMAAPLVIGERLYGILYVDNLRKAAAFTQEELNIFALVAAQAAAAIDNAMTHMQLAEQAVQRSALERFLAPEVVEMVAASPNEIKLGGVNQKVSILFADIRGFTGIAEKLQPQQVVEILNEFFGRATEVIFDHFGTLDKYLGDGLMAIFGAPYSKGNDAAHAVRAAITIQRLMQQINRDAKARKWPELELGIGINTGIVTVGNIGSKQRLDYTVIGDEVNIAARLMSHAGPGQILISTATASELDASFTISGLKPVALKGKSQPVPVKIVRWLEEAKAARKS